MVDMYEIRANYDRDTIVVYQAYSDRIAVPALEHQTFVAPFSLMRMTWIKPSFSWMMYRSNWGQKSKQSKILAVHIKRSGWEKALSLGVLTSAYKTVHGSVGKWEDAFEQAQVHVQWDTERSARGVALTHLSIQVGLSRHIIAEYVEDWIVKIEDMTPLVQRLKKLRAGKKGQKNFAKHLPSERIYSVSAELGAHLMIKGAQAVPAQKIKGRKKKHR